MTLTPPADVQRHLTTHFVQELVTNPPPSIVALINVLLDVLSPPLFFPFHDIVKPFCKHAGISLKAIKQEAHALKCLTRLCGMFTWRRRRRWAEVKARCRNRTPVRWGAVKVSEGARTATILLSGSLSEQRGKINPAGARHQTERTERRRINRTSVGVTWSFN